MPKEYLINGAKFHSRKGFYKYVEKHFTQDLSFNFGGNLNAFVDLLYGGFGKHDYEEPIKATWVNLSKSKQRLKKEFLFALLYAMDNTPNITLVTFEYQLA